MCLSEALTVYQVPTYAENGTRKSQSFNLKNASASHANSPPYSIFHRIANPITRCWYMYIRGTSSSRIVAAPFLFPFFYTPPTLCCAPIRSHNSLKCGYGSTDVSMHTTTPNEPFASGLIRSPLAASQSTAPTENDKSNAPWLNGALHYFFTLMKRPSILHIALWLSPVPT